MESIQNLINDLPSREQKEYAAKILNDVRAGKSTASTYEISEALVIAGDDRHEDLSLEENIELAQEIALNDVKNYRDENLFKKKKVQTEFDFSKEKPSNEVVNLIAARLAIEDEPALENNAMKFMARAVVMATMPYRDPKTRFYEKKSGGFELAMFSGVSEGLPYGIYPRLLITWLTTEAVRTKSPRIILGESLSEFLIDINRKDGGANKILLSQMKRLFSSIISIKASKGNNNYSINNIKIASKFDYEEFINAKKDANKLWTPQDKYDAGKWQSAVELDLNFYEEIIKTPIPIDIRVYKEFKSSPMAIDIYTWLTYRNSYLKNSANITWTQLENQFSNYKADRHGRRNFRDDFVKNLNKVNLVYDKANFEIVNNGIILLPSLTHIPMIK